MIGQVIKIYKEKGFGFLLSINSESIYFKIRDTNCAISIGDKIAYEIRKTEKGNTATAIRKVYINKFGHIFIPRINSHHIHLDLNKYLPQIIDSINTDKCDD